MPPRILPKLTLVRNTQRKTVPFLRNNSLIRIYLYSKIYAIKRE